MLQNLVNKLFPDLETYETNKMQSSIAEGNDGEVIISMLVLVGENNLKYFKREIVLDVGIITYLKRNRKTRVQDIIIGFDFYNSINSINFETIIRGDIPQDQKKIINALKKIDEFILFIADKDGIIEKTMRINWSYISAKETLDCLGSQFLYLHN
jgi:hypothetical protein